MRYLCEGKSGAGLMRKTNQDNLFVNGHIRIDMGDTRLFSCSDISDQGLYAICDGMGGEQFGEEAAMLGVRRLAGMAPRDFHKNVRDYLHSVNADLCRLMKKRGNVRIGTTFVALSVAAGLGYVANIGDSRCYLCRSGRLEQISQDHTEAQRLINLGFLSKAEAKTHPDRHRLTQHLGIFPEEIIIEPYLSAPIEIQASDLFLLCSDGLTDMLSDEEILSVLQGAQSVGQKAEHLYTLALGHGGKDNITLVLVQAGDRPE